MLVLSRKFNEKLVLPLIQTTIQIVSVKAGAVRLGVDAPKRIKVIRDELYKAGELPPAEQGGMVLSREEKHAIRNQLNTVNLAVTMLRGYIKDIGPKEEPAAELLGRLLEASEEIHRIMSEALEASAPKSDKPIIKPKRVESRNSLPPTKEPKPSRRALLVEDDSNERELLAGLLRMRGFDVVDLPDGVDAMDYLSAPDHECDLALIDMMMPNKDGLTTIREIRENHAFDRMKICAMTGHSESDFELSPEGEGIDKWFSKPLNPQQLVRELDAVASEN